MDGGISNNMPADFPGQTITVSPFSGEADICPRDQREGWDMSLNISGTSVRMTLANVFRMKSALFPPDPSVLERIYQGGYRDCLRFLEQRGVFLLCLLLSTLASGTKQCFSLCGFCSVIELYSLFPGMLSCELLHSSCNIAVLIFCSVSL